jgi:hypothetical protein
VVVAETERMNRIIDAHIGPTRSGRKPQMSSVAALGSDATASGSHDGNLVEEERSVDDE